METVPPDVLPARLDASTAVTTPPFALQQHIQLPNDHFRTPFPLAASSGIRDNRFLSRFPELTSFVSGPGSVSQFGLLDDTNRSSLGLVPRNLLRFSTAGSPTDSPPLACSASVLSHSLDDRSSDSAATTGVPQPAAVRPASDRTGVSPICPGDIQMDSSVIASPQSDEVFLSSPAVYDFNTVKIANADQGQKIGNFRDFTDSVVNFCVEQISARSSTADSLCNPSVSGSVYRSVQERHQDASVVVGPFCSNRTFAQFLSRHSLDASSLVASSFAQPQPTFHRSAHTTADDQHSARHSSCVAAADTRRTRSDGDRVPEQPEEEEESGTDTDIMFFDFGDQVVASDGSAFGDEGGEDVFVPGNECLSLLERHEAENAKNAWVLDGAAQVKAGEDSTLSSSWATTERTNISRPSWFTGSGDSDRISIGQYMGARTEPCDFGQGSKKYFGLGSSNPEITASRPSMIREEEQPTPTDTSTATGPVQPESTTTPYSAPDTGASSITAPVVPSSLTQSYHDAISLLMEKSIDPAMLGAMLMQLAATPADRSGMTPAKATTLLPNCSGTATATPLPLAYTNHMQYGLTAAGQVPAVVDQIVQVSLDDTTSSTVVAGGSRSLSIGSGCGVSVRGRESGRSVASTASQRSSVSSQMASRQLTQDCGPGVDVPSMLTWRETCYVGGEFEQWLCVTNLTSRWLEACLRTTLNINHGQPLPATNNGRSSSVFRMDERCTLQPSASSRLRMTFVPSSAGSWEAHLSLSYRTLQPSAPGPAAEWRHHHLQTVLRAEATLPRLRCEPPRMLPFGTVQEDGLEMRHLRLVNECAVELPLRFVIEGSPVAGEGFYFPAKFGEVCSGARLVTSLVTCCTLKSSAEINVPVAFKSPVISDTGEQFSVREQLEQILPVAAATIRVELDVPGPAPTLLRLSMSAQVAAVRLSTHLPDDVLVLPLLERHDRSSIRPLLLHNEGVLPMSLVLHSGDSHRLRVARERLCVQPGTCEEVAVVYQPASGDGPDAVLDSYVDIEVLPSGPCYKVAVQCRPRQQYQQPSSNRHSGHDSATRSSLYCNRQFLYWGTVDLNHAVSLKLTLRNLLTVEPLRLQLRIQGDGGEADPCPFQLVHQAGTGSDAGGRVSTRVDLTLLAGAEAPVTVYFVPRTVAPHSAKLVIKPRQPIAGAGSQSYIKFCVPLRGYGGMSAVHWQGLGAVVPATEGGKGPIVRSVECRTDVGTFMLVATNTGNRPAFVTVLDSLDENGRFPTPAWLSVVATPSRFLLLDHHSTTVTITVRATGNSTQPPTNGPTCHLSLHNADDILLQHFLQLPSLSALAASVASTEDTFLRRHLRVTEPLVGGAGHPPSWPATPVDRSILHAALLSRCQRVAVRLTGGGAAARWPSDDCCDEYVEPPSEMFAPLTAEVTFSETTFAHPSSGSVLGGPSVSPPSRDSAHLFVSDNVIQLSTSVVRFEPTRIGQSSVFRLILKNVSHHDIPVSIILPQPPFHLPQSHVTVRARHYLNLPISFVPSSAGPSVSSLILCMSSESLDGLAVTLHGTGTDLIPTSPQSK